MSAPHPVAHPVILTAIAINTALFLASLWALHTESSTLVQFVREDGLIEWLQFLAFVALAGLLGFVACETVRKERRLGLAAAGIAGLSALVALAALEEVSWFQRVAGIDTPEFFGKHNRQGETNLHNLAIGDVNLNKLVLVKLIFVAGVTHNLILPLLARRFGRVRERVEALGLYLPPLSAALIYLGLVALSQLLLDHPRRGELSEAFGAMHYLSTAFLAYVLGVGYGRPAVLDDAGDRSRAGRLFALFMLFLVLVAWLLGMGYLARGN